MLARRWPVLLCVGLLTVAVGWALGSLAVAVELLAIVGGLLTVGLVLTDRDRGDRPTRWHAPPDPLTQDAIAAELAELDRIEYRVLDHGGLWPQVWVGPTGVTVLDACAASALAPLAPAAQGGTPAPGCVSRSSALLSLVAEIQADLRCDLPEVPVRAVIVAREGTPGAGRACQDGVLPVAPCELTSVLSRGAVLPMDTVDTVVTRLARTLAMNGAPGRN